MAHSGETRPSNAAGIPEYAAGCRLQSSLFGFVSLLRPREMSSRPARSHLGRCGCRAMGRSAY